MTLGGVTAGVDCITLLVEVLNFFLGCVSLVLPNFSCYFIVVVKCQYFIRNNSFWIVPKNKVKLPLEFYHP